MSMLRSGSHFSYNLITLNPPSFPRFKRMENFITSSMGRFIVIIALIGWVGWVGVGPRERIIK
jgi:hypothetical protein